MSKHLSVQWTPRASQSSSDGLRKTYSEVLGGISFTKPAESQICSKTNVDTAVWSQLFEDFCVQAEYSPEGIKMFGIVDGSS
jgi:hypothetical protein